MTRPILLKSVFQGRTTSRLTSDKIWIWCIGLTPGLCGCSNNNEVVRFFLSLPVFFPEIYLRWSPQIIWCYCSNFSISYPYQTCDLSTKRKTVLSEQTTPSATQWICIHPTNIHSAKYMECIPFIRVINIYWALIFCFGLDPLKIHILHSCQMDLFKMGISLFQIWWLPEDSPPIYYEILTPQKPVIPWTWGIPGVLLFSSSPLGH